MNVCSVDGCDEKHLAKGFCQKHYDRFRSKGSPIQRTKTDPNEFVDCGKYWKIKLYDNNSNYVASAKIDSDDVEKCRLHKWYLHNKGYVVASYKLRIILLHRFVMNIINPSLEVDHKYGKKLDNRKNQLRMCNHSQNTQNVKLSRINTSGEKNVSWVRNRNQWRVEVMAFKTKYFIGYYDDFEKACLIARTERKRLHGEFSDGVYDNITNKIKGN